MDLYLPLCFISLGVLLVLTSISNRVPKSLEITTKEQFCNNRLSKLILGLTNYFHSGFLIHIVLPDDNAICSCTCYNDLVEKDFFKQWQVVVTQQNSHESVRDGLEDLPDVFIVIVNNYSGLLQLRNVFSELNMYTKSWNPSAKFLVVTTMVDVDLKQAKHQIVTDIINYLWKRNVLRVALIVLEVEGNKAVASLFSAIPYSKQNNTCKEIISVSQLQEIDLNHINTSIKSILGYEFEPPDSFSGCSVVVNTFSFPPYSVAEDKNLTGDVVSYKTGIEIELVTLMAKIYNITIEIYSAPLLMWLHKYPNGSSGGMLQDLIDYKIDLAFAGGIPPSLFFFRLSLSNPYIFNSVSFYVPDAGIISNSQLVLHSFTGVTWFLLALALSFVTFLYLLMNGIEINDGSEFVDLTMVALTLGVTAQWTKKPHLRYLLLSWSLFSLHLTIMFNTRLFSVLTERPVDLGVETIKELNLSKLTLCLAKVFRDFYIDRTNGLIREVLENADVCENTEDAVVDFLEYRNFSMLVKDDNMAFLVNEKRANIHRLKETFLTYPVLMSVSKHNIVIGYLNRLIYNVTESGLILKWLSDTRRLVKTKHYARETQSCSMKSVLLSKEDFVWLYVVFISGQTMALLVFAIEICCSKLCKHVKH